MENTSANENMKVYMPRKSNGVVLFLVITVVILVVGYLLYKNRVGKSDSVSTSTSTSKVTASVTPTPVKTVIVESEELVQNQPSSTDNWKIYKNITFAYRFRLPKTYVAKVNNDTNSVEVINQAKVKVMDIMALDKSTESNLTGFNKNTSIGSILFDIKERANGDDAIKNSYAVYKTSNAKNVFLLYFYGPLPLNETQKLILSTFSPSL